MNGKLRCWLAESMTSDVRRVLDKLAREADVHAIAVMPDVHLATAVCVGCVLATRSSIYPAAVGGDIGCGMAALRFQVDADDLQVGKNGARILRSLSTQVPTLRHSTPRALPSVLGGRRMHDDHLHERAVHIAEWQLGTLGRGNHFVELQRAEDDGSLWVMVHTGSRGVGEIVREHHVRKADKTPGGFEVLADDNVGPYLEDMEWALAFAAANRAALLDGITDLLRRELRIEPDASSVISCHHNWVRRERHDDADLLVHRKGAISALGEEPGIIPGSMGSPSYHVKGRGHADALCSSSHGAGRRLSRSAARAAIGRRAFEQQMRGVVYDERIADQLRDEAPRAYKDIRAVMRAQTELTRIVRVLEPILAFKGV